MSIIGIITNSNNIIELQNKNNLILINDKTIENMKNIKFDVIVIYEEIKQNEKVKKLINNSKYLIVSTDFKNNKELINENYSYEIATFARSGIANNINFFKIKLNEQTPVTPVDPVDPDTPVTPVNPDTPVVPETPVTPVVPETPVTPTNPDDELNGDVLSDKVIDDNDNNNNNANNSNDINVDKEDESLDSNVLGDKINNKSQPKSKHVQTSDNQDALGFMVAGIVAIIGLSVLIKRKKYN